MLICPTGKPVPDFYLFPPVLFFALRVQIVRREKKKRSKAHVRPPHRESKMLTVSSTTHYTQQSTASSHNNAAKRSMVPNLLRDRYHLTYHEQDVVHRGRGVRMFPRPTLALQLFRRLRSVSGNIEMLTAVPEQIKIQSYRSRAQESIHIYIIYILK